MVVFPPYSDYLVLDTTVGGDQLSGWYGAAEQSDVRHGLRSIKLTEPQTGFLGGVQLCASNELTADPLPL